MVQKNDTQHADDIKHMDQMLHVRKRIGMYLGSNGSAGLDTGLREGVDNSVDEFLAGYGDTVTVRFFPDGSAEVEDNARGLPVDSNKEGINGIILTVGTIGSGGKFSGKQISGGLNGVGISAMNAASQRFDVTVYKHGEKYELSFRQGKPGFFAKPNDPNSVFTPYDKAGKKLKVSKDDRPLAVKKKNPTGTVIRMWPDYSVFIPGSRFNPEEIRFRLKSTCFLVPNMTAVIEDYTKDAKNPVIEKYSFSGGLQDMLPTLTSLNFVVKPISLHAISSFEENTNVLGEDGELHQATVTRPVEIDTCFGYINREDTVLKSYVNIIHTQNGGRHEEGLWQALRRVLVKQIKDTKGMLKAKEDPPTLEDVRDGFIGVISVKFPEPVFTGQEKSTLESPQITPIVSTEIGAQLEKWLNNKKNTSQAKLLMQKIVEAKRIREAAKLQKDTARKKSALESAASMPPKLVECEFVGSEFSELHITEGDSAQGTLKKARDSRFQALFPIRGKILNAQKATLKQIFDNAECSGIIQILGAGSGKTFNIDQLRYHNVCMDVDADTDGAHIRTLLITLFWNMMPELIRQGRLYASQPPLYVLKTVGKNAKIHYLQSDAERDRLLARLDKAGTKYEPLQRLKGLGEMDADEFWDTTLNPETRTLRRITIEDAEKAQVMLELAMGDKVEPRREWIMESREKIDEGQVEASL